jgi:hypothetical protein
LRRKIYYMSQRGSAEMVAEAIAGAAGCRPEPLLPGYMPENINLMFLGCEGARADRVTLEFIASLSPCRVKNAALFQCARMPDEALSQMRAALEARGINVLGQTLSAPLKNPFGRGGPEAAHLNSAQEFALRCLALLR